MRSSGTPTRSVGQYAQSWRASSASSSARFLPLSKPSSVSVPPGPPATVASSALAASTMSSVAATRLGSWAAAAPASKVRPAKKIVGLRMLAPFRLCRRIILLLRGHDDEAAVEARVDVRETRVEQRRDDPAGRQPQLAIEALREAPA